MKKTLKKFIPLLITAGTLVSCSMHSSKPGPLKDLVGLYELETINKKHNVDDKDTYDYKSEIKAKAYFTIDKDGYGFYGYKDKNSKARVDQVFSYFEYDTQSEEHPDYIKAVTVHDGVADVKGDKKEVGCLDEPQLGFHDTLTKKFLEYTIPYDTWTTNIGGHKYTYVQYYQYVSYKKIGNETSLKKINELMGTSAKFSKPFEMKGMKRWLVYSCERNYEIEETESRFGNYEYAFIDIDSYSSGKVKLYYKLKSAESGQVKLVPVSVKEKGKSLKFTFEGREYVSGMGSNGLGSNFNADYNSYDRSVDHYINERFESLYNVEYSTYQQVIDYCHSISA